MKAKEIYMYALAALFVIGYFILIGLILTMVIPNENKDIALMLFGTLTAGVSLILGYFFGSSKGSEEKNRMLLQSKPPDNIP
jgi:FtsH-binding integral membrane protein